MSDPAVEAAERAFKAVYTRPPVRPFQPAVAPDSDMIAAAREMAEPIRMLHKPVPVWGDDCDHDIDRDPYGSGGGEFIDENGVYHRWVDDIGWTCDRWYDICLECCTDDGYQTEECATNHSHGFGLRLICPTARLIYSEDEMKERDQ